MFVASSLVEALVIIEVIVGASLTLLIVTVSSLVTVAPLPSDIV